MPLTCFILIVDDNEHNLSRRAAMFESDSIVTLKARSLEEAKSRVLTAPAIDGVVTDVNLTGKPKDRSGVELSLLIKTMKPSLPIAGYSGLDYNIELTEDEQVFDVYIPKNCEMPEKRRSIATLEQAALAHAQSRIADATAKVKRIEDKYRLDKDDVTVLTSMLADSSDLEKFREAGYSLRLVTNGDLPYYSQGDWDLRRPFVVWMYHQEGEWRASVYQHSGLQASGSSEGEALANLFAVMRQAAEGFSVEGSITEADRAFISAHYGRVKL